jgi:predicted nuclease of restriction endonuclease-like (RecB) superfamily
MNIPSFLSDIREIITSARAGAVRSVNHALTVMYWHIGQRIVEEEQQGEVRAGYKEYLIKNLEIALEQEFGDGYSTHQLELMRQLYLVFPIANAVSSQLTWTHYKHLIRLDDPDKRAFYTAEAIKKELPVKK